MYNTTQKICQMAKSPKKLKAFRIETSLLDEVARAVGDKFTSETDQIRAMLVQGVESFNNPGFRYQDDGMPALAAAMTDLRVKALAASLNRFAEQSAVQTGAAGEWAVATIMTVMGIADSRARSLFEDRNGTLFAQARGLLGMQTSQRLLSDSPEVIALLAWRYGQTTDLEILIANTRIYGLRDAIANHQPTSAARFIRLAELRYVAHVDEEGERQKLLNWFSTENAGALQFEVIRTDIATGVHIRIADANRERLLASFRAVFGTGRASIKIDFDTP